METIKQAIKDADMIDTTEAARLLEVTPSRVGQLVRRGVLSCEVVGRSNWFRRADVLAARGRKAGRPKKNGN